MKKLIVLTLYGVMAFALIGCGKESSNNAAEPTLAPTDGSAQIPNPFQDFESLEEAAALAGFELTLPETMPEGFTLTAYRAIENEMIEIIYENGDNEICIRKAKGSEDISGDYTEYAESTTLTIKDLSVTAKGNDSTIRVATWVSGEFTFSVTAFIGDAGLDTETISSIIEAIQ